MNQSKRLEAGDGNVDELLELLACQPQLRQRFVAIVKLAAEPGRSGRIRSADEVASLLVEEVRKLGNETPSSRLSDNFRNYTPLSSRAPKLLVTLFEQRVISVARLQTIPISNHGMKGSISNPSSGLEPDAEVFLR